MKRVNAGSSEQHTGSRPSEQGADATDDGAIDPSAWLGLLRRFLDGSGVPRSGPSPSSIAAYDDVREQAGCTLWDATASLPYAKLLIQHRLIDVVHAVLDAALNASTSAALEEGADRSATAQHRTIEICFGILSNVCAHEQLADAHLHHRSDLQQLLLEALPCLPDPACVGELCRLLSIALRQQVRQLTGVDIQQSIFSSRPCAPTACHLC